MKYLKYFDRLDWVDRRKETKNRFTKAMTIMTEDETIDYIINHCQDFLTHPFRVLRGIDNSNDFFHSYPVERYSADNKNFYNMIMDNSPKWKNYPKRNKSFICSLKMTHLGYSRYMVIPEDDSRWGIAPTSDIFQSFKKSLQKIDISLGDIDNFFNKLDINALKYGIELSDTDYGKFRNQIKMFKSLVEYEGDDKLEIVMKKFFDENKNIWSAILNIVSPVPNDFKLLTWYDIYEIEKNNINNFEMWTDSPCVFVNIDTTNEENFRKFINKLENEAGLNKDFLTSKICIDNSSINIIDDDPVANSYH